MGEAFSTLRDIRVTTRMMLLLELSRRPAATYAPLAETFKVSIQTISEYIRGLTDDGLLIRDDGGAMHPSVTGYEFLRENLEGLWIFARSALNEIESGGSVWVTAQEDLSDGDDVVLAVREGVVVASRGKDGPSTGSVEEGGVAGGPARIGSLKGILPLEPVTLNLWVLPDGRPVNDLVSLVKRVTDRPRKGVRTFSGWDTMGRHVIGSVPLNQGPSYAVAESAFEASLMGVPFVLVGLEDGLDRILTLLSERNRGSPVKVPISVTRLE